MSKGHYDAFVAKLEPYLTENCLKSVDLEIGSQARTVDVLIDISDKTDYKADYILIENNPFE